VGEIRKFILFLMTSASLLYGQEASDNELQVNFNGYFDNFRVNILYPSLSLVKKISPSTRFNGRYLVDAITAASMATRFDVDGVTSATSRSVDGVTSASQRTGSGGKPQTTFDEVRHEFGAGLSREFGRGASASINALYSTEHDYSSKTLAAGLSIPFAKKNTVLQLGAVRSWDLSFPDTRTWKRRKDVSTLSAGLTQVLSPSAIAQVDASFTLNRGFLSDPYEVVRIIRETKFTTYNTTAPESRMRNAVGMRVNYKMTSSSALQLGYRYYWDDWRIKSGTVNAQVQKYFLDKDLTVGIGARVYSQTRAYFFKPSYSTVEEFMTVDSKLNSCVSGELQFKLEIQSNVLRDIPLLSILALDNSAFLADVDLYRRRTATADWFSRYRDLYAYIVSFGWRVRF
jgi:hypothetical protein